MFKHIVYNDYVLKVSDTPVSKNAD